MKLGLTIFLLFTFYTNISWSLDPAVFRSIKDINQQKLIESSYSCFDQLIIPYNTNAKMNNPDYNDCVVALCGGPSNHPSAWVTNLNFSNNIPNSLRDEVNKLDPIINKIFDKNKKRSLSELEKLEQILKNTSINEIDPAKFTSTFREDIDALMFKKNIEEFYDKNKPLVERIDIQLKIPAGASEEYKKALGEYANTYKKFLYENYSAPTALLIYKPQELFEIAKYRLKKAEDFLEKYKVQLNSDQLRFIDRELEKARASLAVEKPDAFKSEDFFPVIDGTFTQFTFGPNVQELEPKKPICISSTCQKAYIEYFKNQNVQENIKKLRAAINDSQTGTQYLNRCKANLMASAMASTDNEKSQVLFERAKKDIIANVLPRFSEHSRKILLKYLNEDLVFSSKKIISPKDKNYLINEFKNNAQFYLNESDGNSYSLNNFLSFEIANESALRNSVMINTNFGDVDPVSDLNSPCSSDAVATAWDAFLPVKLSKKMFGADNKLTKSLPNKDHVFISDFSCTHDHVGKQNVAHEIGHALNHVFAHTKLSGESMASYKKYRECVTDNYINPQANKTLMSQEGDSIYSEEDTADFFAYMSYPNDKNLFACSLLKPANGLNSYSELGFVFDEGDSHSTAFTRVLMEAIYKNIDLPVSCQRAIKKDSPALRFKKCY